MQDDGEPVCAKSFPAESNDHSCHNAAWNHPGLMQMVKTKDHAIRDPIPLPENTLHFGKQYAAKDKLLAEKGVEYRQNREQN